MELFLNALQLCVIASIFVTTHGDLLISANVDDFRTLANMFLPPKLAESITALVSESAHAITGARKEEDEDNRVPTIKLNKIADIVKDQLFDAYKSPLRKGNIGFTYNPYNKRYKTVKNYDDANNQADTIEHDVLRKPNYKKLDFVEIGRDKRNNTFSDKPTNSQGQFDELINKNAGTQFRYNENMFKNLDFTETKLGGWSYIPKNFQESVRIKNSKIGYKEINGERKTLKKRKHNHTRNENKKLEGHMLDERDLNNKYSLGSNHKDIYERKITDHTTEHTNEKNIISLKNIKYDTETKPKRVKDDKFNQYLLEPEQVRIHDKGPQRISKDKSDVYENLKPETKNYDSDVNKDKKYANSIKTQMLLSRNKTRNDRKDHQAQKPYTSDRYNLGYKETEIYKDEFKKKSKKEDELYDLESKHTEIYKNDIKKESKMDDDLYDLGSKQTELNKHKIKKQSKKDEDLYDLGSKQSKIHKDTIEKQSNKEDDLYDLGSKQTELYKDKFKKQSKKDNDLYDLGSKQSEIHKDKIKKQLKKEEDLYETHTSKHKNNLRDRKEDKPKQKEHHKKKTQNQPIEENDVYEKFLLGGDTDDSNEIKNKHQQIDHKDKILEKKINLEFAADTNNHDQSDEKLLRHKNRYLNLKIPNAKSNPKNIEREFSKKVIEPGYVDKPRADTKVKHESSKSKTEHWADESVEVKQEKVIKAKTGSLIDSLEVKGSTKRFTMRGTFIPKRDFYKLSSPDYYHKLPRIVEKYDFNEPLPEDDRGRDKVYVNREPAMVNKRIKLSK